MGGAGDRAGSNWQRSDSGTIGALVARLAQELPDRPALIDPLRGVRLGFAELERESARVARAFAALGVARGERVAVWAENRAEWVLLELGLARLGAILVTANTALKPPEIEYLLAQSESCAVVFSSGGTNAPYVASLAAVRPRLPRLRHAVQLADGAGDAAAATAPWALGWAALLERAAEVRPDRLATIEAALAPDDVINMQYTSGTTGFPKGVTLTHANLLHNAAAIGSVLGFCPADRLALTVPLFHCFGCVVGVLGAYVSGAALALLERFDAARALDLVARERCTLLYGVPTMFRLLVEEQLRAPRELASLRAGIMGGAPCPEALVRQLGSVLHLPEAVAAYGLTECSPGVTMNDPRDSAERRATTCGKALAGISVRVVDPATLLPLPTGATGELQVRGPCTMKGYWNKPDATAEVLLPDGWLRTGDLATLDGEGYVRIVGRLKEMVIRGGENVYPVEVEEALRRHPGIRDVAVFGVPDPVYGEQVQAAFLPATAPPPGEAELRAFLEPRLAGVKIPSRFHALDAFPMTASGKVQKWRLVERFGGAGGVDRAAGS
ncbi:MAG: AMP-binding protein [Planctomycetes bacterium]|nr:AMP-binding protein [Planctomycetota bacterium]